MINFKLEFCFSTTIVRIYVIKDNAADEESELLIAKQFLDADDAFKVVAADDNGSPGSVITGR